MQGFQGAQGSQGIQGIQGLSGLGTQGVQGPQGPPGPSAYEVAVADGFEGSPEDWLESLIGEPGPPGADGDAADIAAETAAAAGKTTPVDNDLLPLVDSEASSVAESDSGGEEGQRRRKQSRRRQMPCNGNGPQRIQWTRPLASGPCSTPPTS